MPFKVWVTREQVKYFNRRQIVLVPLLVDSLNLKNYEQLEEQLNRHLGQEAVRKCMQLILERAFFRKLSKKEVAAAVDILKNKLQHFCVGMEIINILDDNQKHQYASCIFMNEFNIKTKKELLIQIKELIQYELGDVQPRRLEQLYLQSQTYQFLQNQQADMKIQWKIKGQIQLLEEKHKINLISWSDDKTILVLVYDKINVQVISLQIQENTFIVQKKPKPIQGVFGSTQINCVYVNSSILAIGAHDIKIYNIQTLALTQTLKGHQNKVNDIVQFQNLIYSCSQDGWLIIWNQGNKYKGIKDNEGLQKIIISDKLTLISSRSINNYNLETKQLLNSTEVDDIIISACIYQDYILVNKSNKNPTLELYNRHNLQYIKQFFGFWQTEYKYQCRIENNIITVGSEDGWINLWNIYHQQLPLSKLYHPHKIIDVLLTNYLLVIDRFGITFYEHEEQQIKN
ncbi:hypothetical protein pb186bvf_002678 [Paramecium bursaria]